MVYSCYAKSHPLREESTLSYLAVLMCPAQQLSQGYWDHRSRSETLKISEVKVQWMLYLKMLILIFSQYTSPNVSLLDPALQTLTATRCRGGKRDTVKDKVNSVQHLLEFRLQLWRLFDMYGSHPQSCGGILEESTRHLTACGSTELFLCVQYANQQCIF